MKYCKLIEEYLDCRNNLFQYINFNSLLDENQQKKIYEWEKKNGT